MLLLLPCVCFGLASVSDWRSVCGTVCVTPARLLFPQDSFLVNGVAESEAESQLSQRHLGVEEQQNAELIGKDKRCQ